MHADEIQDFIDLREPARREKKKAGTRLTAAFGKSLLRCSGDFVFSKTAEEKAGPCALLHEGRSPMPGELSSTERLATVQFDARLRE